ELLLSVLSTMPRPPSSPPLPYTTLFRSLPHGLAPSRHRTGPPASSGGRAARLPSAPTLVIERHVSRWVSPNRWERARAGARARRSEEHTSELQSRENLVCRLLLEKQTTE